MSVLISFLRSYATIYFKQYFALNLSFSLAHVLARMEPNDFDLFSVKQYRLDFLKSL